MEALLEKRELSERVYKKLCEVIPSGVNSPVRAFSGLEETPLVVSSGKEDVIVDVDGNSYIDYCCSWGALIHGHAQEKILCATKERMEKGHTFGITSEVEERLARELVDSMDSLEKVRFVSSGTEATMSAIRLARGYTKRDLIVKFVGNYHGHVDSLLVQAGSGVLNLTKSSSSEGIPNDFIKNTVSLHYNDLTACRSLLRDQHYRDKIAAVILEPVAGNMGVVPPAQDFLETLREETEKIGALLIFDEVITGFRLSLRGAQGVYGVKPDITCFGKIIGGGFPAAAFGGRGEIMDYLAPSGPVYQAGTLSGNPVAMEAGLQALLLLKKKGFYRELEEKTNCITHPVKEALQRKNLQATLQQKGSMFTIFWGVKEVSSMLDLKNLNQALFRKFFRYLFRRGVYFPPSPYEACFVSSVHKFKHLEKTRDDILEFIEGLNS